MLTFFRRTRAVFVTALLLLGGAILVLRGTAQHGRDDALGRFFMELMAPLQRSTAVVGTWISRGTRQVTDLLHARDEAGVLRARVETLSAENARLTEATLENERLRTLLDFREHLQGDVLTARVIGRDATGLSRTLTVDRGEQDGIARGAAVLAPGGVVGQVFMVSPHAARVLLLTDHNSGIDGLVQRTRARGIVEGTIEGGCGLKFVKRTEDIQVGDLVVTSGIDGIFPKGLPIGKVSNVDKRGQGLFQYADVAPRVDPSRLEEVLVTRGPVETAEPGPPAPAVPAAPAAPAPTPPASSAPPPAAPPGAPGH
jgi:rod shape-determining protein MreC